MAVSRFEDKTGKGWYTGKIGVGKTPVQYDHYGCSGNLATPASAAPAAGTVEVTGSTVHVRPGPGAGNPVLGTVRRGDRLPIPGESGNWFDLKTAEAGKAIWIRSMQSAVEQVDWVN